MNDAEKGEAQCFGLFEKTLFSIFESESTAHGQEGALNVTESGDETLGAKRISVRLFNLFELANVPIYNQERAMLYPGGRAVGISINLRGLLIVGSGSFRNRDGRECCPAKRAGFRAGDVILSINGTAVSTSEEMQLALNANPDSAQIVFERNNRRQTLTVKPEMGTDGKAKIGAWVRDSTVGIGTLSFVTEKEKASAALGHAVLDADTGSLLNVRKGEMVEADVLGVTKGSSGFPGELRGAFGAKSLRIGSIDVNTELGIFGIADSADYTYIITAIDILPEAEGELIVDRVDLQVFHTKEGLESRRIGVKGEARPYAFYRETAQNRAEVFVGRWYLAEVESMKLFFFPSLPWSAVWQSSRA